MIQRFVQAKHYTRLAVFRTHSWFGQHWFKALCVVAVAALLLKKDISFQINLRSKATQGIEEKQPSEKHKKDKPASLSPIESQDKPLSQEKHVEASLAPLIAIAKPKADKAKEEGKPVLASLQTEKPKATKPVAAAVVKDNVANTFANLAFILNPTYATRKGIAPEIVEKHNAICRNYVKRFAPIAQEEMRKHGIPASVKLAQGLLESDAGDSRLAVSNNNHFGIKCFSKECKKGHCSNFTDDSHKDFFRIYNNAWESYRAHSKFLEAARYQPLKKLGAKNYKGWATGLKAAGYATDPRYAEKLVAIIDALELYKYDQ